MEETIVAQATPKGRGGIAVVRLSGNGAYEVGQSLCRKLPTSWSLRPCSIYSPNQDVIDSGLVVFFASPKSYTGEDVVEIHCHGNPLIVDSVVSSAVKFGARLAEPGEFTKRAFLNNKIDLVQAESVADLIAAKTNSAVVGAGSSLSGLFSKTVLELVDRLLSLRVRVEACLDFPDEDGVEGLSKEVCFVTNSLKKELSLIDSLLKDAGAGLRLREGAKVIIVGPPNCGKSTLLNFLAKHDLAIVSDLPGTTRDLIRVNIDLGGVPVELVDTAGFRGSGGGVIEKEGFERALEEIKTADLVLVMNVVGEEVSVPLNKKTRTLKVFNKVDLYKNKELVGPEGSVFVSALTGEGINFLIESVRLSLDAGPEVEVPILARRRHISCLEEARASLVVCLKNSVSLGGLELVAEDLRCAQSALGSITSPVSSDELLGEIFSSFCIGK